MNLTDRDNSRFGIRLLHLCDDTPFSEYSELVGRVSPARYKRITACCDDKSKTVLLFSELFAKYSVSEAFSLPYGSINIALGEYGKPYVCKHDEMQFSLSHSENYIAFVASDEPAGIDIEYIAKRDKRIENRFFTSNERAFIESSDDCDEAFYRIWTAKEAYVKYTGKGFVTSPASFDTRLPPIEQKIYTVRYNNFCISVCSANRAVIPVTEQSVSLFLKRLLQL